MQNASIQNWAYFEVSKAMGREDRIDRFRSLRNRVRPVVNSGFTGSVANRRQRLRAEACACACRLHTQGFRPGYRALSLQAAASRKRPDSFNDAVADSVEFVVKHNRRVGVTRHEFNGFANSRGLRGRVQFNLAVFG